MDLPRVLVPPRTAAMKISDPQKLTVGGVPRAQRGLADGVYWDRAAVIVSIKP